MDESGVAAVVRRAGERGQTVRPLGAGHAFSPLAVTDHVHLDCSAFAGVTAVGAEASADGSPGRPTVRVRSGTTIGELHEALDALGLALVSPLEVAAPTVGGALAVGMHGSGAALASLSDAVVGLRVVDGRGQVRDVPAADLDAARTSLGALGVILDTELAVAPAGRVQVTRAPRPLGEVLDPSFWDGHDVAEAAIFPSSPTALARWADRVDELGAGARAGDEPDAASSGERSVGVTVAGATGRTALGGAVAVERALPRLVPRMNRAVSRLARTVTATGPTHRVLSSPPVVRYDQSEWALPRDALGAATRELVTALTEKRLEVGLPLRLRLGRAERGWLHPAWDRASGWLSIRVPRGTDPGPVFDLAWRVMRDHVGRPHWGSRHDWTADDTAAAYPRLADFLRVRDDYDPARVFANGALESVLGS